VPPAIAEWPVKNFAGLYMTLHKESTNTKLTAADTKAIENNLLKHVESYFPDTFGDTGTLQGMANLEGRPLAEMADIKHKSTNLSLTWTAEDTAAARESAKILAHRLRHLKETPEQAERVDNIEYLEWIAFETSYHLCLEQRPLPAASHRLTPRFQQQNIVIVLLKLQCHTGI
jgi:hypothetical protein